MGKGAVFGEKGYNSTIFNVERGRDGLRSTTLDHWKKNYQRRKKSNQQGQGKTERRNNIFYK